ncbi:MAG: hypothetical protein LLG00_03770 [Planctomycetaceae bacterium]|nr:hypothetical protein [Planctomycetaceae bacterium]
MKGKWKRRAVVAAILVAAAAVLHPLVLGGLARVLVVNEPVGESQWICIIGRTHGPDGDRCYDAAAKLFREERGRRVLLVGCGRERLAEIGVLPSFDALGRKQLRLRGVPDGAIITAAGNGDRYRSVAETLGAWLGDHHGAQVVLLCAEFRSAVMRAAIDAAMEPSRARQVRVRALADRRFSSEDWWRHRAGFREFGIAWLMRLQQGWAGSGAVEEQPRMNADEYERAFAGKVGR